MTPDVSQPSFRGDDSTDCLLPHDDENTQRFFGLSILPLKKHCFDDSNPLLLGMKLSNDLFERIEFL